MSDSDRFWKWFLLLCFGLGSLFVYALHRSEEMSTQRCLEAIKAKDAKAVELTCGW